MKETEELRDFLIELICILIKECKEHKDKSAEQIVEILHQLASESIKKKGLSAIEGITKIPDELKDANAIDWAKFLFDFITSSIPHIVKATVF